MRKNIYKNTNRRLEIITSKKELKVISRFSKRIGFFRMSDESTYSQTIDSTDVQFGGCLFHIAHTIPGNIL